MPRLRATERQSSYGSPVKTTSIPLNDDKAEKAQRLQSRKQLVHRQTDSLRAAASPARKRKSLGAGNDGPETPDHNGDEYGVRGDAVTPMKRVPILANFEEWMKMATDNKINATNSWNFALIDYFHDMSLLKEGDGVNFQKASCTLDGCVKIYTSRVDSVATETGKLLSGLADSGNKKRKGGEEEGEGQDGDDDGEEGEDGKKKSKKRTQRNAEATLVASFDQLKLKKMELEFSVDPLFKKAAADFDEGGAKGLLMNHLSIDGSGRIVFDSSDDVQEEQDADDESRRNSLLEGEEGNTTKISGHAQVDGPVDVAALGTLFFPHLELLDHQDICPSLKTFELGSGDDAMDLPFLKAPDNWREEHPDPALSGQQNDTDNAGDGPIFDDDDDAGLGGGFDLPPETGFGEGGEAWARDAALEPQLRVYDLQRANGEDGGEVRDVEGGEVGMFDASSNAYGVTLHHQRNAATSEHENILNYFDTALHKNWAGPEHWKIARIRDAAVSKSTTEKKPRKEKEPFEIDFSSPMNAELANQLYTQAPNNSTISLPRNQWRSKTRNLLPDDKHFNSKDLLKLFLKPKAKLGSRTSERKQLTGARQPPQEIDEAYWASHENGTSDLQQPRRHPMDEDDGVGGHGNYNADFFQDDALPMAHLPFGGDDDSFADARDHFSPALDDAGIAGTGPRGPDGAGIDSITAGEGASQNGLPVDGTAFGANLVMQSRRLRPEYVQYARVAKKIDVRRLKENMWRGIGFVGADSKPERPQESTPPLPVLSGHDENATLKFTDIMNNLQHVYATPQMRDISTSFGFICLLHLANEKGLVIENCEGWTDLSVRRDFKAADLEASD
ncbi:barren [Polychaeton citri CBS 116435]|uniref:Condensin complex subunit 2 n=1 Tax=Polychaeton citri CBS 116435 TaxID=1314669 RepID=A0A9P4URC9_9PEZI|nr:barren [Polychaeton citri CBS 116435]